MNIGNQRRLATIDALEEDSLDIIAHARDTEEGVRFLSQLSVTQELLEHGKKFLDDPSDLYRIQQGIERISRLQKTVVSLVGIYSESE